MFIFTNRDKNRPIIREQALKETEAGIHHAQPLVMPREILPFLPHDLAQPALDDRIIHRIIVYPSFIASVIRWIDVDTLHSPLILGEERLQGKQIVPMDHHILAPIILLLLPLFVKTVRAGKYMAGHFEVVVHHFFFSDPL